MSSIDQNDSCGIFLISVWFESFVHLDDIRNTIVCVSVCFISFGGQCTAMELLSVI